jgi:hypothetical protein
MKKSLIAMALMFGAVVFVMPSCGGDDDKKEVEKCTVKVVKSTGDKVTSLDYPDAVEKSKAPTTLGSKDAADVEGGRKGGTYVCE